MGHYRSESEGCPCCQLERGEIKQGDPSLPSITDPSHTPHWVYPKRYTAQQVDLVAGAVSGVFLRKFPDCVMPTEEVLEAIQSVIGQGVGPESDYASGFREGRSAAIEAFIRAIPPHLTNVVMDTVMDTLPKVPVDAPRTHSVDEAMVTAGLLDQSVLEDEKARFVGPVLDSFVDDELPGHIQAEVTRLRKDPNE